MTDAEHRALDERLDIISWGVALVVLAIVFLIPGAQRPWHFLVPFGLVFVAMSVVRKLIPTRRDTEGLILGVTVVVVGLLDLFGQDLQFFPFFPTILVIVGIALIVHAVLSKRLRLDPHRAPEEAPPASPPGPQQPESRS